MRKIQLKALKVIFLREDVQYRFSKNFEEFTIFMYLFVDYNRKLKKKVIVLIGARQKVIGNKMKVFLLNYFKFSVF